MVHPNPTSDRVTITWPTEDATQLFLIDANGRIVQSHRANGRSATMDLTGLQNGLYLLRWVNAGSTGATRVIKQ